MKSNKHKSQKKPVYCTFPLSDEASVSLSHALLFVLNLREFSFENEKISLDSAYSAENKLFGKITTLTRCEVRATAKALDVILDLAPNGFSAYSYIDDEVDGLVSDVQNGLPIYELLAPVFRQAVNDLKKR